MGYFLSQEILAGISENPNWASRGIKTSTETEVIYLVVDWQ